MRDYTNLNLDSLQDNLRVIRKLLNMTCGDLATILGCTRQCVNNYETKKVDMPKHMGIAIVAVIDSLPVENNIRQIIEILLNQTVKSIFDNLPIDNNTRQIVDIVLDEKGPS